VVHCTTPLEPLEPLPKITAALSTRIATDWMPTPPRVRRRPPGYAANQPGGHRLKPRDVASSLECVFSDMRLIFLSPSEYVQAPSLQQIHTYHHVRSTWRYSCRGMI
jgi:hypothetical protein